MNKEESVIPMFTNGSTLDPGLTIRDYFAAKAMQALAQGNYFDATARQAYMIADAMLREREK
jgi:hypothetical protein